MGIFPSPEVVGRLTEGLGHAGEVFVWRRTKHSLLLGAASVQNGAHFFFFLFRWPGAWNSPGYTLPIWSHALCR